MRAIRFLLITFGVLLVAAAGVLRFAVLPAVAKLPANTDTTNVYAGTAPVLLNSAALAPGSTEPLLLTDLPLQVTQSVRALQSNGAAAVVSYRLAQSAGGQSLGTLEYRYALDRKTLQPSTAINASGLTPVKGLTVSFPIGTQKHDYTGWVQDTGTTTNLHYTGNADTVSIAGQSYPLGIQTYVFTQKSAPAPITDAQELAQLPQGIPKSQLPGLVAKLGLPESEMAQLTAVFGQLPDTIPLGYTYASEYTYWVAPRDGVVVDLQATETRAVELPASVLGVAVPIATVSQFVFTDTPATLQARLKDAKDDASALTLVGTTLPLVGLVVGVVLVVVGLALRPRKGGAGVPPQVELPVKVPTGTR